MSGRFGISVVIPALDAADSIEEQLDALLSQQTDCVFEIVVADNGSKDDTKTIIDRYIADGHNVRLVDASRSKGVNVARNEGVWGARSSRIVICDADDVVRAGWLQSMNEALDRHDAVAGALFTGRLNSPDNRQVRPWQFTSLSPSMGFLPYAVGANCGFKKEVFEAIDGFDEGFSGGCDDVDFFWRVQLCGFSLGFAEGAAVDYRLRKSPGENLRVMRSYASREPLLYRHFKRLGMPRSSLKSALKSWCWLAIRHPAIRRSTDRSYWQRTLARRSGRFRGSVRYRVLFL